MTLIRVTSGVVSVLKGANLGLVAVGALDRGVQGGRSQDLFLFGSGCGSIP